MAGAVEARRKSREVPDAGTLEKVRDWVARQDIDSERSERLFRSVIGPLTVFFVFILILAALANSYGLYRDSEIQATELIEARTALIANRISLDVARDPARYDATSTAFGTEAQLLLERALSQSLRKSTSTYLLIGPGERVIGAYPDAAAFNGQRLIDLF
ncbi:MAG: hypothetical protein AAFX39_10660, partial [Pseudomonadota bacterium]